MSSKHNSNEAIKRMILAPSLALTDNATVQAAGCMSSLLCGRQSRASTEDRLEHKHSLYLYVWNGAGHAGSGCQRIAAHLVSRVRPSRVPRAFAAGGAELATAEGVEIPLLRHSRIDCARRGGLQASVSSIKRICSADLVGRLMGADSGLRFVSTNEDGSLLGAISAGRRRCSSGRSRLLPSATGSCAPVRSRPRFLTRRKRPQHDRPLSIASANCFPALVGVSSLRGFYPRI